MSAADLKVFTQLQLIPCCVARTGRAQCDPGGEDRASTCSGQSPKCPEEAEPALLRKPAQRCSVSGGWSQALLTTREEPGASEGGGLHGGWRRGEKEGGGKGQASPAKRLGYLGSTIPRQGKGCPAGIVAQGNLPRGSVSLRMAPKIHG